MIGAIARAQWRATVNAVRRTPTGRRRFVTAAAATLIIGALLGAPAFTGIVLFFRHETRTNAAAATHYLPIIFTVVTLFMLFGNFVTTLNALYFSPTLPLLLAAPVPTRAVFAVALANGSLGAPIALAIALFALIAYGLGSAAGPAYYLVIVIGMLAMALLVASVTQLLVVGLLRLVPARRVREALTLLGALISVIGYAVWYAGRGAGTANRFQILADRSRALSRWIPPGWAGNAAAATQTGDTAVALGWLLLLFLVTGVLVGCAYALFHRAFLVGWSGMREVTPRRRALREAVPTRDLLRGIPSPMRAIAVKEVRTLVRDTKRLSVIVRSVGFIAVYLFVLVFRGGIANSALTPEATYWLRLLLLMTVLLMGLSSGVSGYAFGNEGAQFGLYRLAPISTTTLMLAKSLAGIGIILPFGVIVAVGGAVWLRGSPAEIAVAPLLALWYTLGMVTIRVASAALSPRFDATQPNRSTGQVGLLTGTVVSGLFMLTSFACWAGLALLTIPATTTSLRTVKEHPALIGCVAFVGGIIAIASAGAIWATARRRLAQLLAPQAE